MPLGQTGLVLFDLNNTNSQGNDFEAARGATRRFNANNLPEAASAPQWSGWKQQVCGPRFMAIMEEDANGDFYFNDAS
eukprot:10600539-Prorocentrum_lima.AAC.1